VDRLNPMALVGVSPASVYELVRYSCIRMHRALSDRFRRHLYKCNCVTHKARSARPKEIAFRFSALTARTSGIVISNIRSDCVK
jgi:hypothetical protein